MSAAVLRDLARDLDGTADRAFTLEAEDTRRREAAQVRLAAKLIAADPLLAAHYADAWTDAARRQIAKHDEADMDAVHASRSSRQADRAAQLAAETPHYPTNHAHERDERPDCPETFANGMLNGACTLAKENHA
ncbi:hypothetical protein [Microterricola viridarii]|uniref:Uncharacterized protein n=1 Tax=Microterricola viridarii TaxID=412690 RepID=A0A120I049_9MICO|nr:hypothetical protein [Microterricola viridarii]AMB58247.1 hypothetical protein AWU67_04590 [Microterricola viridarii]